MTKKPLFNILPKKSIYFLGVSASLVLSGCGGGGGGGNTFLDTVPQQISDVAVNAENSEVVQDSVDKSLHQSSNIDDSNETIDTLVLKVTDHDGDGIPNYSFDYDDPVNNFTFDISSDSIPNDVTHSSIVSHAGINLKKAVIQHTLADDSGVAYTEVYTNFGETQNGVTYDSTNYVAGGAWIFIPTDNSETDSYRIGAFVYGEGIVPQASITPLTGSASYTGSAYGLSANRANLNGNITNAGADLRADVALTAEFGSTSELGSISGSITNIVEEGVLMEGSFTLGSANLTDSDGGFFKGDLSGTFEALGLSFDLNGKWGGQFYGDFGNAPDGIAGTASAHYEEDFDNSNDEATLNADYFIFFGAYED